MRHFFRLFISIFLLNFSSIAFADASKFDDAHFDAQLSTGKAILVAVHAPWCPTCRAQAPILKELLNQKDFKQIQLMQIDFDSQKDALKKLNVKRQSTLLVFKGGKEVARSLGDTTELGIESLLQKAL